MGTIFNEVMLQHSALVESLEEGRSVVDTYDLDEFDYGELSFTGKHTRKYKKGQKVMLLDQTGYHDATVTVVSTEIIQDADDNRKYLAVKDRSGNVDLEPLTRRGFLKGDTKGESLEFSEGGYQGREPGVF
jgi:hypothetical protein